MLVCCPWAFASKFQGRLRAFYLLVGNIKAVTTECVCAHTGSGCRARSWCRSAWTRSWTRRRCWRGGNPTFASLCRWPITAPCSTAAKCRETPAAKPVTVTEHKHTCAQKRYPGPWYVSRIAKKTVSVRKSSYYFGPKIRTLMHTKPYLI